MMGVRTMGNAHPFCNRTVLFFRLGLTLVVMVTCFPMLQWVYLRWLSPTGSFLCAAVLTATLFGWFRILLSDGESLTPIQSLRWLTGSCVFLIAFAVVYPYVPGLVSSGLGACALSCMMMAVLPEVERGRSWAIPILVILSIPLTPSLQFFLGSPLRFLVARCTALMSGMSIRAIGVGLSDGHHTVFIDAPCSGIRMLTTSVLLASGTSFYLRLSRCRTFLVMLFGVFLAVAGNVLRAGALFLMETRLPLGAWAHTWIGVIVFAFCAFSLVWLARAVERGDTARVGSPRPMDSLTYRVAVFVILLVAISSTIILWKPNRVTAETRGIRSDVVLPTTWGGTGLDPLPLQSDVREILKGFPGQVAQFRLGDSDTVVLLRISHRATRDMHPAEDCYRVLGWKCNPEPAWMDQSGHTWSSFSVEKPDGSRRLVRQCYFSVALDPGFTDMEHLLAKAVSWPDASSWYWAAARPGSTVRTTLAVTVEE
ncbi:MAG TPA: archaeosortase/exosortase family protein, partial [bacterium]|nr:archaeosortase/exosortase family protein [bacterium]